MDGVWEGLARSYASMVEDLRSRHDVELTTVGVLGISAMTHGYVALDADGELLVPFRTWRNTTTGQACAELTPLLGFAVPQRWTIAHLHQSILEAQPHLADVAHLKTLATYVHWMLTGEHVVGLDEASGMFPIDRGCGDWDADRVATFDTPELHAGDVPRLVVRDAEGRGHPHRGGGGDHRGGPRPRRPVHGRGHGAADDGSRTRRPHQHHHHRR